MKYLISIILIVLGMIPLWGQEPDVVDTTELPEYLISSKGLSEMRFVFKPGLKVGSETVTKTFQPSFVVTSTNTLLVFCQGRLKRAGDNDVKVILMNSSRDFGKTWDGVRVLSSPMNHFAISPYVSPGKSGERISFLTCVGLKVTKAYYDNDVDMLKEKTGIDVNIVGTDKAAVLCRYYSDDDGATWQLEVLTGEKTPLYQDYKGYTPVFMNTIGQVHKVKEGPYAGRYILAAPIYTAREGEIISDNFRDHACSGSGIIYSDDMGESWQMDGMITDYLANEASAIAINKGEELFMIRRYMDLRQLNKNPARSKLIPQNGERIAHTSSDGGLTWSEPFLVNISHVKCHGTLAKIKNRLYFSIPGGLDGMKKKTWDDDRVNGSIYFSDDDGKTWNYRIIEESYFSYSTVGKLSDEYLITIYSRGGHGDKGIAYRIFTDAWLEDLEFKAPL
jgi:sialidase-1